MPTTFERRIRIATMILLAVALAFILTVVIRSNQRVEHLIRQNKVLAAYGASISRQNRAFLMGFKVSSNNCLLNRYMLQIEARALRASRDPLAKAMAQRAFVFSAAINC